MIRFIGSSLVVIFLPQLTFNQVDAQDQRSSGQPILQAQAKPTWGQSGRQQWFSSYINQLEYNKMLAEQLEITDSQKARLKTINDQFRAEQSNLLQDYRENYKTKISPTEYSKRLKELRSNQSVELEGVLLKHQRERLSQIILQKVAATQSRSRSRGSLWQTDRIGLPLALAKQLELTNEEKKELEETITAERDKIAKTRAKMEKEAADRVLKLLPKKKRDEFRRLIGEPYDFAAARQATMEFYRNRSRKPADSKDKGDQKK